MLFIPGLGAAPSSGVSEKTKLDRAIGIATGPKGPGFQSIMAQQGSQVDKAGSDLKGVHLPLTSPGTITPRGEVLPLQRQSPAPSDLIPEAQALLDLDKELDQLLGTIQGLLEQEGQTPGEGPLSTWLAENLDLDEAEVTSVIDALQSWVDQPPAIAVDIEQLIAAGPDGLSQVEELKATLSVLRQELSGWLAAVQPETTGPNDAVVPAVTGTGEAGSDLVASLVDRLASRSSQGEHGLSRAATMIAQILQTVQNSANSGGLPLSMDFGEGELELLTSTEVQPSQKTAFTSSLLAMARESLSARPELKQDISSLTPPTAGLESLTSGVSAQSPALAESPLLQPDPLTLQRLGRPLLASDAGRQLGERIQMMIRGDIQHATIRLDPPELGALEIRVTVQNDQTQVHIVAPNAQVREALESQSARLREFLEQQGLSLADLDVRDGSAQERDDQDGDSQGRNHAAAGEDLEDGEASANVDEKRWRQGLVDQFV